MQTGRTELGVGWLGSNFKETAGEERARLDVGPETQSWCWPGEEEQGKGLGNREREGEAAEPAWGW